jgi:hypothetical protein
MAEAGNFWLFAINVVMHTGMIRRNRMIEWLAFGVNLTGIQNSFTEIICGKPIVLVFRVDNVLKI